MLLSGLRGVRKITHGCKTEIKVTVRQKNNGKSFLISNAQNSLGIADYFSRCKHFPIFSIKLPWKAGNCRIVKKKTYLLFYLQKEYGGKLFSKEFLPLVFFQNLILSCWDVCNCVVLRYQIPIVLTIIQIQNKN